MKETQLTEEVIKYISDQSYNYAILIDGEWGSGKTYYVKNACTEAIEKYESHQENPRKVKYISLYGCKNIEDIKDCIVIELVDSIKDKLEDKINGKTKTNRIFRFIERKNNEEKKASGIGSNILAASKRIGLDVLKNLPLVSEKTTTDIASKWLLMNSYIFIFDDVERCECSLNEVFGFINGLVEHEGTKAILVANEKEIKNTNIADSKAAQYSVILNERIKWPERINDFGMTNPQSTTTKEIELDELEERRKLLFPEDVLDDTYKRIREKLIGVTLEYEPDIETIAETVIRKSELPKKLKTVLVDNVTNLASVMDNYNHKNLRTFQFFISKMKFLYEELDAFDFCDEHFDKVLGFVIEECFVSSVIFKGNISAPTDKYEKIMFDKAIKAGSIKRYVEKGKYNIKKYRSDIKEFIDEEIINKISDDDPINLLENGWFKNKQEWVEERIAEIKDKMKDDDYPIFAYSKIVFLILFLIKEGFPESYLDDIEGIIQDNISKGRIRSKLSEDPFLIMDNVLRKQYILEVRSINDVILHKRDTISKNMFLDILKEDNWVELLIDYTNRNKDLFRGDVPIFRENDIGIWVNSITNLSPGDLNSFRMWLHEYYPLNMIRKREKDELLSLEQIGDELDVDSDMDIVKKNNLKWLKTQIKDIVEHYN